ncbi:uncharacterized protein [Prorops nasuta]|uniref:uncharacterized protein n=1 Tax=Prorops nasuta TaxID=863751 RepID=UPI0034CD05A6
MNRPNAEFYWDAPLPEDVLKKWNTYRHTVSGLTEISINRWLGPVTSAKCELHGFADASMRAYAAAIYLRVQNNNVLLVKLFKYLMRVELFRNFPIIAWSDIRDALAWIRKHPSHWKVFVANRVSYIQTELPSATWKYVPTNDNPADLATRSLDSGKLKDSKLWWYGPQWLLHSEEYWPLQPMVTKPVEPVTKVLTSILVGREDSLLTRYSSLSKLLRVTAYCLRYARNCKCQKSKSNPQHGFLTTQELEFSRIAIIRLAQSTAFNSELICLKAKLVVGSLILLCFSWEASTNPTKSLKSEQPLHPICSHSSSSRWTHTYAWNTFA